jgi:hypothetical protein
LKQSCVRRKSLNLIYASMLDLYKWNYSLRISSYKATEILESLWQNSRRKYYFFKPRVEFVSWMYSFSLFSWMKWWLSNKQILMWISHVPENKISFKGPDCKLPENNGSNVTEVTEGFRVIFSEMWRILERHHIQQRSLIVYEISQFSSLPATSRKYK